MRSAPAVTVRCSGGRTWAWVLCALPALAAAATVYWAAQHAGLHTLWAGALAVASAAAAAWAAARQRPAPRLLCWDGVTWSCDGLPVQPQVMVDTGGSWMLLRLRSPGGPDTTHNLRVLWRAPWVAVCEQDAGPLWHPWRAAVYSFEPLTTANSSERPII